MKERALKSLQAKFEREIALGLFKDVSPAQQEQVRKQVREILTHAYTQDLKEKMKQGIGGYADMRELFELYGCSGTAAESAWQKCVEAYLPRLEKMPTDVPIETFVKTHQRAFVQLLTETLTNGEDPLVKIPKDALETMTAAWIAAPADNRSRVKACITLTLTNLEIDLKTLEEDKWFSFLDTFADLDGVTQFLENLKFEIQSSKGQDRAFLEKFGTKISEIEGTLGFLRQETQKAVKERFNSLINRVQINLAADGESLRLALAAGYDLEKSSSLRTNIREDLEKRLQTQASTLPPVEFQQLLEQELRVTLMAQIQRDGSPDIEQTMQAFDRLQKIPPMMEYYRTSFLDAAAVNVQDYEAPVREAYRARIERHPTFIKLMDQLKQQLQKGAGELSEEVLQKEAGIAYSTFLQLVEDLEISPSPISKFLEKYSPKLCFSYHQGSSGSDAILAAGVCVGINFLWSLSQQTNPSKEIQSVTDLDIDMYTSKGKEKLEGSEYVRPYDRFIYASYALNWKLYPSGEALHATVPAEMAKKWEVAPLHLLDVNNGKQLMQQLKKKIATGEVDLSLSSGVVTMNFAGGTVGHVIGMRIDPSSGSYLLWDVNYGMWRFDSEEELGQAIDELLGTYSATNISAIQYVKR